MPVIDVQVHPFDRNHPGRPWASPSHGLDSATGEEMVAAMNSVGVDGAIMVSSFSAYEYDPSYALEVYNTYPDKFRVVTPVDATNPAIDDVVAKWAATPGARGIRIRMRDGLPMDADYAYYIYGVGHHTEDDCRTEDSFMQVYRPLYENSYAYRNGGLFDLRSAPHRSGRRGHRAVQRQSRTRHHAETPGQGRGGRRRDPVSGLRRCLLRHRRPVVRGRRYDCAVRNTPRADL